MLFYVTTALVVSAAVILIFWVDRHEPATRNGNLISLAITMAGTLAGVFIAISFADLQSRAGERPTLIALLTQAIAELDSEQKKLSAILQHFPKDLGEKGIREWFAQNPPLHTAATVEYLLSNPVFPKYASPYLPPTMASSRKNMDFFLYIANSDTYSTTVRFRVLSHYVDEITMAQALLLLELQRLKGEIVDEEFERQAKAVARFRTELWVGDLEKRRPTNLLAPRPIP